MDLIPIAFTSYFQYIAKTFKGNMGRYSIPRAMRRHFNKAHQMTESNVSKGNILWNPYNFLSPSMSCHL